MVVELHGPRAVLDIPKHTCHVAGRRDDLPVVDKPAAAEVARVCAQLSGDLDLSACGTRSCASEGVDGADVIEATACDEVAGRCIRAGHDPRGAEWDGVDLVCGVGVPHDELAVLGCGDDVAPICGPVERVDFCEVALECPARLEGDAGERGGVACHGADWLSAGAGGGGLTACVRSVVAGGPDLVLEPVCLPPRSRNLLLDIHWGGKSRGEELQLEEHKRHSVMPTGHRRVEARASTLFRNKTTLCISAIYLYRHSSYFTSQHGKPVKHAVSFHSAPSHAARCTLRHTTIFPPFKSSHL